MEQIIDVSNKLIIDYKARSWCKLPYPGHPKGCPNYNIGRKDCPPDAPLIKDKFDLDKPHWFAVVDFNLKEHKEKLKKIHSDWTERQLGCCLYWQGSVRKKLKELAQDFVIKNPKTIYSTCPEAMGIHVINTLSNLGVPISKDIKDIVYKVALIGYEK